jgi:hypothetical protein
MTTEGVVEGHNKHKQQQDEIAVTGYGDASCSGGSRVGQGKSVDTYLESWNLL